MELQRDSRVPLHRQLKDALRLRVQAGEWQAGQRVPSETELAQTLGIARGTVRTAITELVHDGLLERRQGDGTYVVERSIEQKLMGFYSFARDAARRGVEITSDVVHWGTEPADRPMADKLAMAPGEEVRRVMRVRSMDGERVLIETCVLPLGLTQRLQEEDFTHGALYDALERFCRLVVTHAEETFEAVALGEREAQLLGMPSGAPALRVQRLAYTAENHPVEVRDSLLRADRCRYHLRLG